MSFDKAQVIAQVLKTQAEQAEKARVAAVEGKQELDGAQQALGQFAQQVHQLGEVLEKEVNTPELLDKLRMDSESGTITVWVRRFLSRVVAMADQQSQHLKKQLTISEGKIQAAITFRDHLLKQAEIELARAARAEEIAQEQAVVQEEQQAPKRQRRKKSVEGGSD